MFKTNGRIIPIMHCFDNNYVVPASVAFVSMLENANKQFFYKLYVLHSDISEQNQKKLKSIVEQFENATLEFINMQNKFQDLFDATFTKGHYSKEIYYKFLAPSLFPQYEKMIISDVDVVYNGDISKEYLNFEQNSDSYFAGVRGSKLKGSWLETFFEKCYSNFSDEERNKLLTGAGYWIFNLKKMRDDGCEQKFLNFAKKNIKRLKQPEQDVVNSVCFPNITLLPLNSMVCTYMYDLYKEEADFSKDLIYTKDEIRKAIQEPIQVHYASCVKPWNTPTCTKSEIWFSYLLKTPFFLDVMNDIRTSLPDSKYYLFSFIRALKIKNNKINLFGFIPLKKKNDLKDTKNKHKKYNILGLKLSLKNPDYYKALKKKTKEALKIQDSYNLSAIKNAKKLIMFLIPPADAPKINGGIMSIFSLCETSREINNGVPCLISTFPNCKYTYACNDLFLNNENIYRFSQIVENASKLDEMILHIPEYYADDFYKDLKRSDIKFLKSIPNLHINILNQNIELMPEPKKLSDLYKLTNNITQTIAHARYATQEVCDKWQIPTHLFSVNIDISKYKSYSFEEKEKIIVLSPDENEHKAKIVEKLKQELPDWQLVTVQNMTFPEYVDLISRAFFTITFGEGMDGYFTQPQYVNSVGFAVYNDKFFPSEAWKNLKNVYLSFDEMKEKIVSDIKKYFQNKEEFEYIINEFVTVNSNIYQVTEFEDNLKRFYKKEYDFITSDKLRSNRK